jgi:hypothetical protein
MSWKNELRTMADSLCVTCRYGHVQKGFVESQESAFCTKPMTVRASPFPVRECTDYDDRRHAPIWEMKEYALILIPTQSNKAVGFITVEQFRNLRGDEPILPINLKPKRE